MTLSDIAIGQKFKFIDDNYVYQKLHPLHPYMFTILHVDRHMVVNLDLSNDYLIRLEVEIVL